MLQLTRTNWLNVVAAVELAEERQGACDWLKHEGAETGVLKVNII